MKPLTLDKALQLYDLIGEYVPNIRDSNEDAIDFIGTIIHDIKESGNHQVYIDAVSLMTDKTTDEILKLGYEKALNLFIKGLSMNQIISLKTFCDGIGY